jgi:hypothetical protein
MPSEWTKVRLLDAAKRLRLTPEERVEAARKNNVCAWSAVYAEDVHQLLTNLAVAETEKTALAAAARAFDESLCAWCDGPERDALRALLGTPPPPAVAESEEG